MFSYVPFMLLDSFRKQQDSDDKNQHDRIMRKLTIMADGDVGLVNDAIRFCRNEHGIADVHDILDYIQKAKKM